MQETPTLVSYVLCPYVQRAAIVLREKSLPFEQVYIDLADKPDWFNRISPLGKVPLLQTRGAVLFESAVIAEYLDEISDGGLLPETPLERAQAKGWVEVASALLNEIGGFYNAADEAAFATARQRLRSRFERLEEALGEGPYFAGKDFSMIDAAFAPAFRYFTVFDRIAAFGFFQGLPRLQAWKAALETRPSVIDAATEDYAELLLEFLMKRPSILAEMTRRAMR